MGFWLMFGLWIGTFVLGQLLLPRRQGLGRADENIKAPTIDETRPIPVVYGQCLLAGPNVAWWGDLLIGKIKVETGAFGLGAKKTVGYKYSLGQQLVLCHGPLDQLLEVRFDDRAIPLSTALVDATNDGLAFQNVSAPTLYATIPHAGYTTLGTLAKAASDAMDAAWGATHKIVYLFEVIAGFNDQIKYGVNIAGSAPSISATVSPGRYGSPQSFRAAVESALNASEAAQPGGARVTFTVLYSGGRYSIMATKINAGAIDWRIYGVSGYNLSVLPMIGLQMGNTYIQTGFPSTLACQYDITGNRFLFAFSGIGGRLMLDDALFTSAWLLGFQVGAVQGYPNYDLGSYKAAYERIMSGVYVNDLGDYYRVNINQPNLFGGDEAGSGGVVGDFDIYKGTLTQTENDYLTSVLGPIPGYRGVAYAVSRRAYLGNDAFLKPVAFVVGVRPNELGTAGKHNINGDANAACAIYQILTNTRWGRGISPSSIDTASFTAAADTLYTEGLGVSLVFDKATPASDMIAELLRHVDGVIYPDPTTGLLKIKLARADYVLGTLTSLNVDNADAIRVMRPSWGDTKNTVRVKYTDRASNYSERVASAQDLANVQARGGEVAAEDFDFRGLTSAANAQKAAARVLKAVSYPLAVVELKANREAYALRPGDVFRLTSAPLGITDMACRVTRIRTGDLMDGTIVIDAVEDVFSVAWTAYTAPPASGWVDPVSAPAKAAASALLEAPYPLVGGADRYAMTLCARGPTGLATSYETWSDPTGGSLFALTDESRQFTPAGTLSAALDRTATSCVVIAGPDMATLSDGSEAEYAAGGNLALVDSELVAWHNISDNGDGTYTLSGLVRGCVDTVPAVHSAGAAAWFVSEGSGLTEPGPYAGDLTVAARFLPKSAGGTVDINLASTVSLTTNSRAQRPYVPRNVQQNGVAYAASITGQLTVSWANRNRLGAWQYSDGGLSAAIESGCTYTLRLYGTDGLLKKTYTGLTGTSQAWTTEAADSGGQLNDSVRIELECVNAAGQASFQTFNYTVWRSTVAAQNQLPHVAVRPPRRMPLSRLRRIGRGGTFTIAGTS